MIPVRIMGTASLLPGRAVSTAEVAAAALPGKDPAEVEDRIGIRTRYWVEPGTRMAPLGADVLRRAAEDAGIPVKDLQRVIFVSSTGGDYTNPATASSIIDALGINNRCDGFDVANACVGFLTALDLGARSVATGISPVGIVVVELMSRFITPGSPRPYLVLGDAAAAVVLGPGRPGEGLAGTMLRNDGARGGTAYIDHPGLTRKLELSVFALSGRDFNDGAMRAIADSAKAVLAQCGEDMENVRWVLPHQPNGRMLSSIADALGVGPSRLVPVVRDIGSVCAASIPVSLDRLRRSGAVSPGDRILMAAVGSGLSYGAMLYQTAA